MSAHIYIFILFDLLSVLKLSIFSGSDEDADEGFVINQEGIGLRLTAMEYWKCSEVGITLPSVHKKEPDCKFVIAESLPEQGNGSHSPLVTCLVRTAFDVITAPASLCLHLFQEEIKLTLSWRSTEPLGFSILGCTQKILFQLHK